MPPVVKRQKRISVLRIGIPHDRNEMILYKVTFFPVDVDDNFFRGVSWPKEDAVHFNTVRGIRLM